jgi:hypothetical protein
MFASVN